MIPPMNPDLDLTISRIIKAPRSAVWRAWTDPARFAQWWLPAPMTCRVVEMEVAPGGALLTEMSEPGGEFTPHMSACFLAADELQRIVFTTSLTGGWRPADKPFIAMTAIITLREHAEGTDYSAVAMHKNPADRQKHDELGFQDGWGTVTAQLAMLAEGEA
ncbi:MAG: activator of ATPase [Caulobacteraceae bacterium]|nr:activator of ATPase [Caulobacteraceae bacterium]